MSQQSADLIKFLLKKYSLKKMDFIRLTGISKASFFKYINGSPIHPLKAQMIVDAFYKKYRHKIPKENLID